MRREDLQRRFIQHLEGQVSISSPGRRKLEKQVVHTEGEQSLYTNTLNEKQLNNKQSLSPSWRRSVVVVPSVNGSSAE